MPKIQLEFSIPEDPKRNVVTVTIEGPDPKRVTRTAMSTIDHYTRLASGEDPPVVGTTAYYTGGADGRCERCSLR